MTDYSAPKLIRFLGLCYLSEPDKLVLDKAEEVNEPSVFQVSVLDLTPGPLQERKIKWRTFSIEIFARIIILNQSNQSQYRNKQLFLGTRNVKSLCPFA